MKKLAKLLVFLLLAGVLSGCTEVVEEKEIEIRAYDEDEYAGIDFKLENDDLVFELDQTTTQFTVTQKSTGKVWYSNPVNASSDPMADSASKNWMQSILVMEYTTESDLATLLNTAEHSVPNGIYTLEKPDDNTIKVNYSIGKVAKKFIIPPSVPESRMMEWYEQLDRSIQKRIDNAYRKIDINSLLETDNVDELLAKYPDLETTCVYEIRSATKDHQKQKIEEALAEIGYTEEEYEKDLLYYPASSDNNKPIYNISIVYHLDGDELVVEVPMQEIEYKASVPLTELRVLPYFGAGSTEDEGFLFVPEGSGGIINFNNGKSTQTAYYAQMYGWDYGNKRDVVVDETKISFPVFGISYADGSVLGIVEEYSSLAVVQADVSGRRNSYNNVFVSYDMVHGSQMDITGKSDAAIIAYEKSLPEGSLKQTYRFLETSSYVDMAKAYRESLLERYPDLQKTENTNVPISVELIGAVDKVKQILGMPVTLPEVMTDFDAAEMILTDLSGEGYENLSVRYQGWMNGGIDHAMPKDIDITSGMGGTKGLKDLITLAESVGADVYLTGRVQNAYDSNIFDGFFKSRDVAKYISRDVVEIPEFSNIWFASLSDTRRESHFLLRPSVCVTLMESLSEYSAKYNAGVGFDDVGDILSGDYNQKRAVSRETSMDMQMEQLAAIKANGTKVTLSNGNEYVLPYADLMTEVDFTGKNYALIDYAVPFYEIAIHGLVDYTGNSVNLSGDAWDMVLKSAEAGAGLSFTFYEGDPGVLQGTEYMDFFGANYDGWKDMAKEYATRYEKEMAGLNNTYISDHRVLAEGVTATYYEDNAVVYVNTTLSAYTEGDVTIPARDYLVERSEK